MLSLTAPGESSLTSTGTPEALAMKPTTGHGQSGRT
jgi:hypothetical protein